MLSEIHQTQKDKYYVISLIHGIKTTKTSEQIKQSRNRLIDTRDKLMSASGEWRWGLLKVMGHKRDKLSILR